MIINLLYISSVLNLLLLSLKIISHLLFLSFFADINLKIIDHLFFLVLLNIVFRVGHLFRLIPFYLRLLIFVYLVSPLLVCLLVARCFQTVIVFTSFFILTFVLLILCLVLTLFCLLLLKIMKCCYFSLKLLNLMDVWRIIHLLNQHHEHFFPRLTFCNLLRFFLLLSKLLLILILLKESTYVAFHLCINQKEYVFYHQFAFYLLLNL